MASLPYPHRHEYTSRLSGGNHTDNMSVQPIEWVWQGCHTLLQIPILLFLKNLFFCLFKNNMFSCSHVFKKNMFSCSHVLKKHVLLFSCLKKNMFSCSYVFKTTTCSHVLLSFKNNMFFCLSPKRTMFSIQSCLYVAKKKRLRATLPAVKP